MMLKEKCSTTDAEWEERQKTRQMEMEACSKALAVLSSDDAHDLFTKTFNPAFMQTESKIQSDRRSKAAQLISEVAKKLHSPRLTALATKVRLDAFTRVKKAIDDLVAQLLKEKEDLLALIEDLELQIKTLTSEIDTLKAEIAEMNVQMKRAGEDREKENQEFQQTVADQRASQKLLQAALNILK